MPVLCSKAVQEASVPVCNVICFTSTTAIFHMLITQNGVGDFNGQEGNVIGGFHPERDRVQFLEANLDKLSFQHKQV